nr:unnamed protein product [Callosobruchus analis]
MKVCHKIAIAIKASVRAIIQFFPLIPSHYIRKNASKMDLEEGLNITKMHRMHKEYMKTSLQLRDNTAKFLTASFNISFFLPKKNQCLLCTVYKDNDQNAKSNLQDKFEKRSANKEAVRSLKDNNKRLAIDTKPYAQRACFDLQKVLVTPQSEVSTFFYKSKIATYNYTLYDMGNNEGFCYVWYEEIAKRDPNEIHLLYVRLCGCQASNHNNTSFFGGHTQNESDIMHVVIETAKKRQSAVFTPSQWITLTKLAKVTGKPYSVKEMSQDDFQFFQNGEETKLENK